MYVEHSTTDLVAQRIYGLIQGYEDLNDHERLHYDPVFALAVSKSSFNKSEPVVLAGKSTLNRLEYCPETVVDQTEARYHRISHKPKKIERLLVEFLPSNQFIDKIIAGHEIITLQSPYSAILS